MSGLCLPSGGLDERDARLSSGANLGSRGAGANSGGLCVGGYWSARFSDSGLRLGSAGLDDWDACLGGGRSWGTGCGNGRGVLNGGFSCSTAGLRGDDSGGFDGTLGGHCCHFAVVTSGLGCVDSAGSEGQSGHNVG